MVILIMMGNDWEWIEGSGIFRSNVWDSVKIRTESAAQETPLINRARYFFFFFTSPSFVSRHPFPTDRPATRSFTSFTISSSSMLPLGLPTLSTLDHRIRFSGNFQLKTFSPPLPRDEIRGTLKFLYFRSIFGRYVLYPKNIYSSQDLFGEIKKQKTFILTNIGILIFLHFFLKPCFFYF